MRQLTIIVLVIFLGLLLVALERASGMTDTLWVLRFMPVGVTAWFVGWRWAAALALLVTGMAEATVSAWIDPSEISREAAETGIRVLFLSAFGLAVDFGRKQAAGTREPIRSDPSTGLANARALFEAVDHEVERAKRYGRPFTLAYVTLENLETVRLRSGRAEAEEMIRRAALHIKGSLRGVDIAARLRGREFALLLPETGAEAARSVLGRIERSLISTFTEEPHRVSFCVGATTWVSSDLSVKALHQHTYQLMYAARRAGTLLEHEILDAANEPNSPTVSLSS
jgi:diguanylate cyclase (GGDEF)-like protein